MTHFLFLVEKKNSLIFIFLFFPFVTNIFRRGKSVESRPNFQWNILANMSSCFILIAQQTWKIHNVYIVCHKNRTFPNAHHPWP
jgi:hypothetical protein